MDPYPGQFRPDATLIILLNNTNIFQTSRNGGSTETRNTFRKFGLANIVFHTRMFFATLMFGMKGGKFELKGKVSLRIMIYVIT